MPDRMIPPRWRVVLRLCRALLYACVVGAGVMGIVWQPVTLAWAIGAHLTTWWMILAALGGVAALVGVVIDRWPLEWLATWPAAGGLLGYAITVWRIAAEGEPTRLVQAFVVTGLFVALCYRGLELAAHAAKLRAESMPRRPRRKRRG